MIIEYVLTRYSDNRDSTLGLLHKKMQTGKLLFQAYTLEDQFQEVKVRKETRVPAKIYEIVIQMQDTPKTIQYRKKYTWFQRHLMLKDVPNFTGVYLHIGNTDEDTEACILLGDNADNNVIGPGSISNSTASFMRFYKELYDVLIVKGNKAFIDIRDEIKLI